MGEPDDPPGKVEEESSLRVDLAGFEIDEYLTVGYRYDHEYHLYIALRNPDRAANQRTEFLKIEINRHTGEWYRRVKHLPFAFDLKKPAGKCRKADSDPLF